MVRAVADRAFLPTKNLLEQVGDMMILTGKTVISAIRPPYPYGGEFIGQFLFALRLLVPAPDLDRGDLLRRARAAGRQLPVLFGALDRLGGFFVLTSIREFGPSVTSIILAGVAGSDHRGPRRAQDPRGA